MSWRGGGGRTPVVPRTLTCYPLSRAHAAQACFELEAAAQERRTEAVAGALAAVRDAAGALAVTVAWLEALPLPGAERRERLAAAEGSLERLEARGGRRRAHRQYTCITHHSEDNSEQCAARRVHNAQQYAVRKEVANNSVYQW